MGAVLKECSKVAILGKLPTKFKAPFDNMSYDIWAFNTHSDADKIKRVSTWFDIHTRGFNPNADVKRAQFPFKECEELLGGQYFNNSASYLIAYAILKGYKTIELYGMKFIDGSERRRYERQNVRELIFFARGRGINISAPYDGELLREYELYGT